MSTSDFRQLANRSGNARTDRLFRAAVSAYCALPRPSRREAAQLEDLLLPLFDGASVEARRYVAAVLSEIERPPAALVRRLCEEPVEVAAPLLIRSKALTDIDLLALIGRHGLAHGRAIARRPGLNPAIANLVRALERMPPRPPQGAAAEPGGASGSAGPDPDASGATGQSPDDPGRSDPGPGDPGPGDPETSDPETSNSGPAAVEPADLSPTDAVRRRLRSMMLPALPDAPPATDTAVLREAVAPGTDAAAPGSPGARPADAYGRLRATALTGNSAFFQTALADALGIGFRAAGSVLARRSYEDLLHAARALDLDTEKALLLCLAAYPAAFAHAEGVRLFVARYEQCPREEARERLRAWRAASLAEAVVAAPGPRSGSNGNAAPAAPAARLRAS